MDAFKSRPADNSVAYDGAGHGDLFTILTFIVDLIIGKKPHNGPLLLAKYQTKLRNCFDFRQEVIPDFN